MATKKSHNGKKVKATFPRPDFKKDQVAEAPPEYLEQLGQYSDVVAHCLKISRQYGGYTSPTSQHAWASILFTALCTKAVSLAFLAPYSQWAKRNFEHWDYASVANVARTIMETRLNYFYLCIEKCSREEWECRWNMLNLHDCRSRMELLGFIPNNQENIASFQEQITDLTNRLHNNAFFTRLPASFQNKVLKGGKAHLFTLEEMAVRAGIELDHFRMFWKLMSSHIHSLPMSFYRMVNNERGRGVQTKVEVGYTIILLSFCMTLLVHSRDEYIELMDGIEKQERQPNNECIE